jgi:flavin reductase (DIM6/NTAB) family NADH-FMN oxidoreductase RutF
MVQQIGICLEDQGHSYVRFRTEGENMKYQYKEMPESMRGTYGEYSKNFGFNWKEFVMGIPTPMFLVTTYKSNGQPNATMQSWAGFASAKHGGGYYAILSSVNKRGHLYQSLNDKKEAALNFMSSNLYEACMKTIQNNQFEADEITSSGLTVVKASWIKAPMIAECFMNLECKYMWEKEIVPGDDHVMICLEVVGGHIEKDYMEDMFGGKGILYNVHYPINPEDVKEKGCDYVAALRKVHQSCEY